VTLANAPFVVWLVAGLVLLGPPASVTGVVVWARSMQRRQSVPGFVIALAYGLAGLGTLAIAAGTISGIIVGTGPVSSEAVDPSQKARALAEGVSEAMNCGALALLIALVAAVWLALWGWRGSRPRG
jgi:biopolymer transport protein ExbB